MKFTKVIKAENIYEKYKADMANAESKYQIIEKDFKELQDALLTLKSKTFDVYQTSVTTDNPELVKQAKAAWELADDVSWDKISKLHEAILKIIYK